MSPQRFWGEWDAVDVLLQESFTIFFICVDVGTSRRKADFISFSIVFYSSIMNLGSLSNVSHSIGTSPHSEVKTESVLQTSKASQRVFLAQTAVAFPELEGQPHPAKAMRRALLSSWKLAFVQSIFFLPGAHVLQGASLRDSAVKRGHNGSHRRAAISSGCSFWMTALTRRYIDSLCSQRSQKPASSSFPTRFVFL